MSHRDHNPDPRPSEPVPLGDLIAPQMKWIDAMRNQVSTEAICELLDQHYQMRDEALESLGRDELSQALSGFAVYLAEPDAQIVIDRVIGAGNEGIVVLARMQRANEATRDVVIKLMAYDSTNPESNDRRENALNEKRAYEQAEAHRPKCMPEFLGSYSLKNPEKDSQTLQVLVLGYIQAISLSEHIQSMTAARLREVPELFEKMLTSFEELDRIGIHHFDLSPQNILVHVQPGERLTLKIVDFACSRANPPGNPSSEEDARRALVSFGETWFSLTSSLLKRFPHDQRELTDLRDIAFNLREGRAELRQARQYFHLFFDK